MDEALLFLAYSKINCRQSDKQFVSLLNCASNSPIIKLCMCTEQITHLHANTSYTHTHTSHMHTCSQKWTQTFTASFLISILQTVSRRSRQLSNETRAGVKSSFAETMAATGLVFCASSSSCCTWREPLKVQSLVKERMQLLRTHYRLAGVELCSTQLPLFHGGRGVNQRREQNIPNLRFQLRFARVVQYTQSNIYNKKYWLLSQWLNSQGVALE